MLKKEKRTHLLWKVAVVALVLLTFSILLGGAWMLREFERELPEELIGYSFDGPTPRFYLYEFTDRTNRQGEETEVTEQVFGEVQTDYVSYEEIPQTMIHAFVAIEDKHFFDHRGVDWRRTLAATANYFLGFSDTAFGASTITQQLVKNMTGQDQISPKRKLQEAIYALRLEERLDKSEILELYLNIIHFSDHCNGIAEASMHYFSKPPAELTTAQTATIAAITNNPSYYNPIRNPENNLARRNLILREMHSQGFLTDAEYLAATEEPLGLEVSESESQGINSWYADMVIEDVITDLSREYSISRAMASQWLYSGGLQIYMAMDEEVQSFVEDYYQNAIRVPTAADGTHAQSALIVIDAKTGDILGVAGAVGEKQGNRVQNFATQTLRPPGSAIKPLTVFAPALEKGLIHWASVYDDVPVTFTNGESLPWPKNATGVYRGLTNVAYAVAHSTNTVAVRILEELGLEESFAFAKEKFHLEHLLADARGNDKDLAALALGQLNYGLTLRELSTAYTAFADGGMYHASRSYYRVVDARGRILLSNTAGAETVLSDATAAIMTKMMQKGIAEGTSSAITLGELTECAGKTGTSNRDYDRWFIGYTPELICGVWCGYEYPQSLEGKNLCTTVWNTVMTHLVRERGGKKQFDIPTSIVRATYCRDSGKLLSDVCEADPRGGRQEIGWFVKGQEPQTFCDRHVLCSYDSVEKGISHGFCPEADVIRVALLRIQRQFPKQILVMDAQYVYAGDPLTMPANPSEKHAYFQDRGIVGLSHNGVPFHRSCPKHQTEVAEETKETDDTKEPPEENFSFQIE
ncbi:MAG: transglycosylase domain-containing protein [Clostridia bacterium]|nr:transglycosylase domain-containing protein [Clostridia bacterium]